MRKSEIFNEFVKIAQEKGLSPKTEKGDGEHEFAEHTEKNLDDPRWDSLSIEQIGKLYGTKPKAPKEMEYERNIIENAHPKPVVFFMSHDKLNSLVENENEGQDARIHISLKEPDGHLTQRKYAEKKLVLSLVRLANDLDNRNQDELRALADTCLVQATNSGIKKNALVGLLVYPIAAAIAAIYVKNHRRFNSDGWARDYDKTIAEIDDLLNSNSNWGVGYSYTPQFLQTVNQLKTDLGELNTEVQKALPILDNLQTPRNATELKVLAQQPETHEAVTALNDLSTVLHNINPLIQQVAVDFGNEQYKQRAIEQKGFLSSVVDSAEVLHGGRGLVADDIDDVRHALATLVRDVDIIIADLTKADTIRKTAIQQLSTSESQVNQEFSARPAQAAPPAENTVEGLDEIVGKVPGMPG